jgi:hypothetical protein
MAKKNDPLGFNFIPGPLLQPGPLPGVIPGAPTVTHPSLSTPSPTLSATNPTPAPTPAAPPDYRSLILNDPIYKQQIAAFSADAVQAAAERKANIDQALIHFGQIPNLTSAISGLGLSPSSDLFQSLGQDVDAATVKAAQGLTSAGLSTVARLQTGHTTALDNLMNTLAARGIVRSGATGVGTDLENKNYIGAQYDARQALLSYLSGVQAAWAQAQSTNLHGQAQAASDAAARAAAGQPPVGTSAQPATPPPASAPTIQPVGGGVQLQPGGAVTDTSGGYYDPSRGVYVGGR